MFTLLEVYEEFTHIIKNILWPMSEEFCLLGYNTMQYTESQLVFWKNIFEVKE
jgi:hypothetical protein